MTRLACRALVVVGLLAAVGSSSCSHTTGPSLTAEIVSEFLEPTSTIAGADTICCCRVQGVVRNTSSIPVHLDLSWTALDDGGGSLGTAMDVVANVEPGESRPFDAAGIFASCSRVAERKFYLRIIGLYHSEE
jgi:hypothetical protein